MSDDIQAPEEGTPENAGTAPEAPGTPQEPAADQINWQQRYEDMRSEFDRRGTRLSEVEQQAQLVQALQSDDPDLRRQAMDLLGLEVVDDQPQYEDPQDAMAARLEALEQQISQRDQQAAQQAQIAQIEQHVEQQLAGLDGLSERDQRWIVNQAVAMPPTPEGMPDIQGAYKDFQEWEAERQQKWASTKRTPHRVSPVGEAGTQVPDLSDPEQRQEWMVAQYLDRQADT